MIRPVLLCGGSGTRLWPLSRRSRPKQFADILGDSSLFQQSALRFSGEGFLPPLVVTAEAFRFVVAEQLAEVGIEAGGILIEPEGRNTAAAAAAAALATAADQPEALMLLTPADHAVPDAEAFRTAVRTAAAGVGEARVVTFGIRATRPETGFGWLEAGEETAPGVFRLSRFVEKPEAGAAARLLADPRYRWNAGVFLARPDRLLDAFREHAPEVLAPVEAAFAGARRDLGFTRLDAKLWAQVPEISLDYAVMEKEAAVGMVPFDGGWTDLGSWQSVWQESARDARGNALSPQATAIDCEGSMLRSESPDIALVGIGLKDIVAVAMGDAVLVADRSQSQKVGAAVTALKARGVRQATQLPVDHRPWGWFETLVLGDRFQVKRIHVHPGGVLSLQSHYHRSEHWVVVGGTARVTIGDEVRILCENESVYIPLGARHRLENPGRIPTILIEVQTGAYLGEDDIRRYEDIYARSENGD